MGWGVFGIVSTVLPDLLVSLHRLLPSVGLSEPVKWVDNHPVRAHLIAAGAAVLAYLVYAPYKLYSEVQIKNRQLQDAIDRKIRFSIIAKGGMFTPLKTQAPLLWLVHNLGQQISPIHISSFIQLTNLSGRNVMIDEYGVYRLKEGNLIQLPSMQIIGGSIVNVHLGNDFKRCLRIDVSHQSFDSLIKNKHIAPDETIQGWIFLETSEEAPYGPLYLKIRDTTGAEGLEEIRLIQCNRASLRAQDGSLVVTGETSDLSHLKRVFYSDRVPIMPL